MKKILLTIAAVLLLCYPAQAQMLVRSVGTACDTDTDYIGDKTDYSAANLALSSNTYYCVSYQATTTACSSGTFGRAFFGHNSTATDNVKIAIYPDSSNGTAAPNGESLLSTTHNATTCSADNATPTCTNSDDLGGAVTKNGYYFICVIPDTTSFDIHRSTSTGGTVYYQSKSATEYTNWPPATIDSSGWNNASPRAWSWYVEIK